MIHLTPWQAALVGVVLAVAALLLTVWWRQQSLRWPVVLAVCAPAALLLSWWSGLAFQIADYRAGCDGLCPGNRGAPIPFFRGEAAGGGFMPGMFAVNFLVYLVLLLAWSAVLHAVMKRFGDGAGRSPWRRVLAGAALLVGPFALGPLYLPPPEAHVRGDPQRIAINAQREVYLYDQHATWPILRVGLEDVRPRSDGQPGMRVCLRTYTVFYLPTGHMYLDMAPEGVHSNTGGVLPLAGSCWE